MTHPIGEVPHAGLDPELFDRFHQEMVAIKNNRKYTYTQRLYDKGYSKSEMQSKRTAINSKYNQKSLMTATTLRALEGLLSQDLFIAMAKDVLQKERYGKNSYDDAKYILETLEKVIGSTENHLKATITYGDDIIFDNTVTPEKPKDDKPKGDKPKGDKPKGDTPKGDTPKEETPKETPRYQEGKELPRTGDEVSRLGLLGMVMLGLSFFGLSHRKKEN